MSDFMNAPYSGLILLGSAFLYLMLLVNNFQSARVKRAFEWLDEVCYTPRQQVFFMPIMSILWIFVVGPLIGLFELVGALWGFLVWLWRNEPAKN